MSAEVFSGKPVTNFGEDEAGLPSHDWDVKQAEFDQSPEEEKREKIAPQLGSTAAFDARFDEKEWGPAASRQARNIRESFGYYVESDQ